MKNQAEKKQKTVDDQHELLAEGTFLISWIHILVILILKNHNIQIHLIQ